MGFALAENVNNSLRKGMEVLAVGEWVDDSYSDEQGQRHTLIALEARFIGAGLRWATATVQKANRFTGASAADPPETEAIMAEINDGPADNALTGGDRALAGVGAAPGGAAPAAANRGR